MHKQHLQVFGKTNCRFLLSKKSWRHQDQW